MTGASGRRLRSRSRGLVLVIALLAGTGGVAVGSPTASGEAPCASAGLRASFNLIPNSGAAGSVFYRLVVTDDTGRDCWLGRPLVSLRGAGGVPLPSNSSFAGTRLFVPAGGGAAAVVKLSGDVSGAGEPSSGPCEPAAASARIAFAGAAGGVTAVLRPSTPVCEHGHLGIETWQPVAPPGSSRARLWANRGDTVGCGIERPLPGRPERELLCSATRGIPRARTGVGDPYVTLAAAGRPRPVLISQFSYLTNSSATLRRGSTWSSLGVTCRITAVVSCVNGAGHGFRLGGGAYTSF